MSQFSLFLGSLFKHTYILGKCIDRNSIKDILGNLFSLFFFFQKISCQIPKSRASQFQKTHRLKSWKERILISRHHACFPLLHKRKNNVWAFRNTVYVCTEGIKMVQYLRLIFSTKRKINFSFFQKYINFEEFVRKLGSLECVLY